MVKNVDRSSAATADDESRTLGAEDLSRRTAPAPKAGERVAALMEAEIGRLGWPVGHMLGTEAALIDRYGVSRAVLREAIRQVEQRGAAIMRRGRGGGLIVAKPVETVVTRSLANFLECTDVGLEEIWEVQSLLEMRAAVLAAENIDEDGIAALRALGETLSPPTGDVEIDAMPHAAIRAAIAEASGNGALALFIRALNMSTLDLRSMLTGEAMAHRYRERVAHSIENKQALIEAIVSGRGERAHRIVEQDRDEQLDLYASFARSGVRLRDVATSPAALAGDDGKLSRTVMMRIARDVARLDAPPGERIGSEPEMLARYGVGRAVFREALRPLEQYGVVRMRRGAKGGLFVATADASGIVSMTIGYLRHMRLAQDDLFVVRRTLELEAIALAIERASDREIAGLRDLLAEESARESASAQAGAVQFHLRIAQLSHNRPLALLIRILSGMIDWRDISAISVDADIHRSHSGLMAALEARDGAMGRRRMNDHIDMIDRRRASG